MSVDEFVDNSVRCPGCGEWSDPDELEGWEVCPTCRDEAEIRSMEWTDQDEFESDNAVFGPYDPSSEPF